MKRTKLTASAMALCVLASSLTWQSVFAADDSNWLFHSTFEDGMDSWTARGSATVTQTTAAAQSGSYAAAVTNRADSWNGIARSLGTDFSAGTAYSFSVMVMHQGAGTEHFKFTLEYTDGSAGDNGGGWGGFPGMGGGGQAQYDCIAEADVVSGEWVQLANVSYTLPAGATGMTIYIETEGTTADFFVDEIAAAPGGTAIAGGSGTVTPPTPGSAAGDLDMNGTIDKADVRLLQNYLLTKPQMQPITKAAMDMDGNDVIDARDLTLLKRRVQFPPATTTTTTVTTTTTTTTQTTPPSGGDDTDSGIMQQIKNSFNTNPPAKGADTGKTTHIQYQSKPAGAMKGANIWTPAGYSENQKYNVLYMLHGVFGDESGMLGGGWGVREMASTMIASGDLDPFIIVFPQMYSGPGGGTPGMGAMNMDTMDNYDKFLEDMTESLMPYVEQHYSINTGKKHTAVAGFSMGGRESLYLGISRPDLFGYVCASSPAPGIVPASDMFISNHLGSKKADGSRMTNADFKIDKDKMPYLLMIGGGTNDGVVGTFPKEYHELFTKNGTDHIWHEFPGGGHDDSVGFPMFYNFYRGLWK